MNTIDIRYNEPAYVSTQTADGVTWFAIRDYGYRQEGVNLGTGAFFSFQSRNAAGTWGDWVMLNGGLIDMTPGKEQGDLDILCHVDGQINGVAVVGRVENLPGFIPIRTNTMHLGRSSERWVDLYLAGKLDLFGKGVQIKIEGTYQWRECLEVQTQWGLRYLPLYKDEEIKP